MFISETPYGEGKIKSDMFSKLVKVSGGAEVTRTVVISLDKESLKNAKAGKQNAKTYFANLDLAAEQSKIQVDIDDINAVS